MMHCKFKLCEWNRKVDCRKGGNFKKASLITLKGLLLGGMCVGVCCVYTYIKYVYRNVLTYTYIRYCVGTYTFIITYI